MKARKRFEIIPRVVDTTQRRIILNVGGRKHETYLSTVRNYPDTRLYWVVENVTKAIDYDSEKIELFFDRHPSIFEQVLNYYRTGKLHCPHDVCGPLFEEELAYWGIDEKEMEHCCWTSYSQHRDAEHNLKSFNVHEGELDQDTDMESDKQEEPTPARDCGARLKWWTKYQPKIWPILEEPHSSKPAKIFSIISVALIMLSVGTSCALTLPQFSKEARAAQGSLSPGRDPTTNLIFSIIDYFCGIWFTFELLLRIIFCPRRRVFFRRISNWIDILSVMPFYLRLLDPDGGYLADALLMIRLLRLFRFFRLLYGLQILLHTLKASSYELGLLLLILLIPVILFSSIIYYIERAGDPHTKFRSIPESFWWSLITMTTVGYGDITPKTWGGKIIGGACAICGLLVVALPISIIGSNFNLYYAHAQARLKLPKKKNKVMLNTITSDFSNRSHTLSGTRRKGLRMRSHATLENGEDGMAGTRNSISNGRVNSFARQNSNEVKRNSRAWSIPSNKSTPDINTQSNEAKLSPKTSIITRERKYSRNERVVPKLGDLPEKDESEENDHLTNPRRDSEPNQNQNNNYRDSLDVPDGVEYYSPGDRLPLWIAQNGKTSRWRSFSVPSNAQRPFQSHLPRKSHSDSSNMCKRCSLPRETQDFSADVYDGSSSGEGCCRCYEFEMERSAHPASNHSTYTIYIPGVDESVQVSTDSLPAWSKELPFTGTSPVQFDFVSCWKRKPPDDALSDAGTTHDQEERETLISDLESECNGSRKTLPGSRKERDLPLLFIDLDMRSKHDDDSDRETTI